MTDHSITRPTRQPAAGVTAGARVEVRGSTGGSGKRAPNQAASVGPAARTNESPRGESGESGESGDSGRSPLVEKTVERLNDYMQLIRRELRFSVDDTTGATVVRVIDAETDEVLRQIPPEQVLSIVKHLEKSSRGSLMYMRA